MQIPFYKPTSSSEFNPIDDSTFDWAGDNYRLACEKKLETITGAAKALIVSSCTHALEMAIILANVSTGDEVILPSFTFVSAANAIVLRGGIPVFVDCRADNMNIDETLIEQAITPKTKAIIVMHYGGVSCDMISIMELAKQYNLVVIEDAAHCIDAYHNQRHLGTYGHLSTLSFHFTKNVHCGEGGALLINDLKYIERSYVLRDKGTNRQSFLQGLTKQYSWLDMGSSYSMSELSAAILLRQLNEVEDITKHRRALWNHYATAVENLNIPSGVTAGSKHNGHIFYILLDSHESRRVLISSLAELNVDVRFHYVPLHSSPYGRQFTYIQEADSTSDLSNRLLRLPLFHEMTSAQVSFVVEAIEQNYAS